MALPAWLGKIGNFFLLRDRIRDARGQQRSAPSADRSRAANQARLLVEVARRVAEPVEALPEGVPAAVQLSLYADATHWALLALGGGPVTTDAGPTSAALWESADVDALQRAAGGSAETLASLKPMLLAEGTVGGNLSAQDRDVAEARKFVESLVWELDAPSRRIERLLVQRWLRIGLAAAVVLVAAFGIRQATLGPNLIANRPFQTSTTYEPCARKGMCWDVMLHTLQQDNPWAEFDIGSIKPIRRIEITHRSDCCPERGAGMVAEVSTDRVKWTVVGTHEQQFAKWTVKFSKRPARYVRLRIPRNSVILNLDNVVVR